MKNAAFTREQMECLEQMFDPSKIAQEVKAKLALNESEIYLLQLFRKASDESKTKIILSLEQNIPHKPGTPII